MDEGEASKAENEKEQAGHTGGENREGENDEMDVDGEETRHSRNRQPSKSLSTSTPKEAKE